MEQTATIIDCLIYNSSITKFKMICFSAAKQEKCQWLFLCSVCYATPTLSLHMQIHQHSSNNLLQVVVMEIMFELRAIMSNVNSLETS